MSTLSNEETSCLEDQVRHSTAGLSWDHLIVQTRMVLAEVGAHTGARTYNTMQELAGTTNAIKLGSTGNHLTDTTLRRLLKKRRRLQQEYKGALELARLQIGLGGDVHWERPDRCAAWNLDFIQKSMQQLCLNTTTATGCALGVKHLFQVN